MERCHGNAPTKTHSVFWSYFNFNQFEGIVNSLL